MKIRVARVRKFLSQGQVAMMIEMTIPIISDIELGKKDSRILTNKRIADALVMEMKDFL